MKKLLLAGGLLTLAAFSLPKPPVPTKRTTTNDPNTTAEVPQDNKLVIYQLMTRLFGNKVALNKPYGTIAENGCGKFNDITDKALDEIKKMGVSHVWYTGVIEHATMTDYAAQGIPADDADVVKGRAGSPYAIKDYYDVAPDLAVVVKNRMPEYEALIKRTHDHGLKVLMDFIPNHVARSYKSDAKPQGVVDLGAQDDKTKAFAPNNNFYYLPGKSFVVPAGYNPLGPLKGPREDGKYTENPAKATGNDVFSEAPHIDDWFETTKLNYGVDYQNARKPYFSPVPDTWKKMRDILVFWAGKKVDGFRCDMAEMVPLEFWAYVIPEVKKVNPNIIFIAEAYNPKQYKTYLEQGKFDFLYDKVGLYDGLRRLMRQEGTTEDITKVWKEESNGFASHMLRFLENHDEQRIASKDFATDPKRAIPAMTVTATLASGPVMLYSGQEVAEPAHGSEGFSGEDGRTTIFDYWGVPEHQKWMNQGKFDGAKLSAEQKNLRSFYAHLLNLASTSDAIRKGRFYELQDANNLGKEYNQKHLYTYLRYTDKQQLLVVVNFSADKTYRPTINVPAEAVAAMGLNTKKFYTYTDVLNPGEARNTLNLTLAPLSAYIFEIKPR
ncbi:alpha-amylase family glycosyl hydrolase [Hymenobacter sp. BT770]|uniref:alpha-amylase family glycosyl hydrolase n=1 Tax=Hymenobacter sp. BT770 TaxID=2886942 RepID=UPI001D0FEAD7|nr:alpha-amylase family glycosyl hydrolase [Hymenobacter sp. BT770]MCC3154140.1 alpha-amylase [Hymenobacter sp. BT770]MDO3414413.1 alpha-amylase family glycosyl hydrolase [Hymenobacter sp. BT770]